MERYRFLFAVFTGTLFYVLISLCGGRDSIWASKQLQKQKQYLSTHTVSIEKINSELSIEKIALEKDLDVIASYAKKLGFVSESERLIKVTGLPLRETHIFDPGTILKHTEVKYIPESLCKAIGLFVVIVVYVLLVMADIQKGHALFPSLCKKKETLVYDMP